MEAGDMLRSLLQLIAASGGSADTQIRIQKEAFLAAALGIDFSAADFDYYHYGPFSRSLSDALHAAVNLELLNETKEDFNSGVQRYTYSLTPKGRSWVNEETPKFRSMKQLVERLSTDHWRALELAATAVFFKMRNTNASTDETVAEALKKKPDTKPFELQAKALLADLML